MLNGGNMGRFLNVVIAMSQKRNDEGRRHSASPSVLLLGGLYILGSGALALGPDVWMEWLSLGLSTKSQSVMRMALFASAAIALIALIWPLLKRR